MFGLLATVATYAYGNAFILFSAWSLGCALRSKEEDEHPAWWLAVIVAFSAVGYACYIHFVRFP